MMVHPNQIQEWKTIVLKGADHSFERGANGRGDTEGKLNERHAKIGELTMERDFLSKARTRG